MLELRALRVVVALGSMLWLGCEAVATVGSFVTKPFASPPPFEEAVTAFNNDLRWGRVRQAVGQVERDQQERFLDLFESQAAPFQFTSIDVVTSNPVSLSADEGPQQGGIEALVSYEFYRPPMVVQETVRQRQTWRYVEAEERWVVSFDFAPFDARAPVSSPAPAAPAAND